MNYQVKVVLNTSAGAQLLALEIVGGAEIAGKLAAELLQVDGRIGVILHEDGDHVQVEPLDTKGRRGLVAWLRRALREPAQAPHGWPAPGPATLQ